MIWDQIVSNLGAILAAIGGIGVVILGISAWIGNIIANRIVEKHKHEMQMELERIKNDMETKKEIELTLIQDELEKKREKELAVLQSDLEDNLTRTRLRLERENSERVSNIEHRLDYEFNRRLEAEKKILDLSADQNNRYSVKQFELFFEIWNDLQVLRQSAEQLWQRASAENIIAFNNVFSNVKLSAQKVSLVMDEKNLRLLQELILRFEHYRIGKQRLVEIRSRDGLDIALTTYYGPAENEEENKRRIIEIIEHQIHENHYLLGHIDEMLNRIRTELQAKLAGTPFKDQVELILLERARY